MHCPRCRTENSDTAQFCARCHATLRFICPACKHLQTHPGKCDQCGVDFLKYAMMVQMDANTQAARERERARAKHALFKQIVLLPITGGLSLLGYLRSLMRRN